MQAPAPARPSGSETAQGAAAQKAEPTPRAPATTPAAPAGPPAGTGVLRAPGVPPQEVPLMSIQRDTTPRVEVGPLSRSTGVADVLLGSIGIVAVAVIGSLILGAVLGAVLVFVKHRLGWGGPDKDAEDHISVTRPS